jgi:hypothetical protein
LEGGVTLAGQMLLLNAFSRNSTQEIVLALLQPLSHQRCHSHNTLFHNTLFLYSTGAYFHSIQEVGIYPQNTQEWRELKLLYRILGR